MRKVVLAEVEGLAVNDRLCFSPGRQLLNLVAEPVFYHRGPYIAVLVSVVSLKLVEHVDSSLPAQFFVAVELNRLQLFNATILFCFI